MSEYIVTCDEEVASWIGNDVDSMKRLVRCRDCRHFKPGEEEPPVDWCDLFHDEVTPCDFCKWGERGEA